MGQELDNPKIFKEVCGEWQTRLLSAKIAAQTIFTEGEQEFYKEKGFENEPQRCFECRRARKAQRMANRDRY